MDSANPASTIPSRHGRRDQQEARQYFIRTLRQPMERIFSREPDYASDKNAPRPEIARKVLLLRTPLGLRAAIKCPSAPTENMC
jgi:hypothetical protein